MNLSENVYAALSNKPHDRIPFFADLSWYYTSLVNQGKLDKQYEGQEGMLKFHTDLGVSMCFYPPGLWKTEYTDLDITVDESGGRRVTTYNSKIGKTRQVEEFLPSSHNWAIREHFIKTVEDLRIMTHIWENTNHFPNYEPFTQISKLWGDFGTPVGFSYAGVSPLQRLLTRWAGVVTTYNLLADYADELEEIFLRLETADDAIFDILAQSPAFYIEICDNLSSEITGAYNFERYNAPVYKKHNDNLHKAGKFTGIHIDGTLRGCLKLLAKCGFDAAEAVTPAPVGDIQLADLRAEAGDIVIWGGIPGALFSPIYGEEFFKDHIDEIIRVFGKDNRFILGTADQVPPDGLLSRVSYAAEQINAVKL